MELQWSDSRHTITDITKAAGWEIISCEKDALAQDIRLICAGGDSKCDNLYESVGAVGKIVRLPEAVRCHIFLIYQLKLTFDTVWCRGFRAYFSRMGTRGPVITRRP